MVRRRVLAVLAAFVVIVGACAAPSSSGPGTSVSSTTAPSLTGPTGPTWTPRPPEALLFGAAIRPSVAELNVRELPSTSSKSLGLVTPDNVLVIEELPSFDAEGYTWYKGRVVSATGRLPALPDLLPELGEGLTGWIAVAKGATSYVQRLAPRCPAAIDLFTIAAMLDSELLACFGDNTIELEAVFGCGGCGGSFAALMEPDWLAHPYGLGFGLLSVAPLTTGRWGALMGHSPPGGPEAPPGGSVIRVRGHFDDERAGACRIALPLPGDTSEDPTLVPIDRASATLYCRQRFVVGSYEVLGTDPDYVPG